MKNFNILGDHWKIQFLGEGHNKPIYREDYLKRGDFSRFRGRGELGKKEVDGVFMGGDATPMHTM